MSFYDYGRGNHVLQSYPKSSKLHFYLKCVLDCLESYERKEVINSYSSILLEVQGYLSDIVGVVFEGKRPEGYAVLQDDFSYVLSGLNIEDIPNAKEILLDTIDGIKKIRLSEINPADKEKFDYTKIFLDKVVGSPDLSQMWI